VRLSWIGRSGKHRADSAAHLRVENARLLRQLIGAAQTVKGLEAQLNTCRGARAEAEELVVALSADLDERSEQLTAATDEANSLRAKLDAIRGSDDTQPITVTTFRQRFGTAAA
jgi:chromosome segregation ATPase